jgi:hypothetical protein
MDLLFTIVLSAAIILFGFGIIYLISYILRRYNLFTHAAQFFISVLSFIVILSFTYVAFGEDAVKYLMSGLFIGVGLALQPMMKTVTKGFVFDGTHLSKYDGTIEIVGKSIKGTVHTVGMIHTWIIDSDGNYFMVSNDVLNQEIIKVYPTKTAKNTKQMVYDAPPVFRVDLPAKKKTIVRRF